MAVKNLNFKIAAIVYSSINHNSAYAMDENKKRLSSEALASSTNDDDARRRSSSSPSPPGDGQEQHVANLIRFARASYTENPTDALSALLQAMKLHNGPAAADAAMHRVRAELGDNVMDHVLDKASRRDRAVLAVQRLLHDESTFLYQTGREDLLRQTMEDGSSVVCSKCGGVVASSRWEQHQAFWCDNNNNNNNKNSLLEASGTTTTTATATARSSNGDDHEEEQGDSGMDME
jgi:hypothetical protein